MQLFFKSIEGNRSLCQQLGEEIRGGRFPHAHIIEGAHGFGKQRSSEKVAELTTLLGLGEVSGKRAGKLSGGWQRRLSIAMALISEPEILFLDEPTLGLDVLARSDLWDVIRSLKGKVTIVMTTHDPGLMDLADKVYQLQDGELIE